MTQFQLPENSKLLSSDFILGVATAAFQIEGGAEHRLPSIWDTFCDTKGKIADGSTGLTACDHFNLWREDVELISEFGVDAYRLSISWPRVIKENGELNEQGAQFYLNILNALQAKGIKAFVTLYHWDLPQHLENKGGWLNRDTAYKFAEYADKISQFFGDKVHAYATLNEPFCSAFLGYEDGTHAPGKVGKEYGKKAAHHLLLAHGLAMRVLQKNSPKSLNGIVLNFTPCYPESTSKEDLQASQYADQYFNHWYAEPVLAGKYPEIIDTMPDWQKPDILDGDLDIISTPLDFLGVNFYTRAIYRANACDIFEQISPPAPITDIGWEIFPQAFTDLLTSLNAKYALPPVYITENGAAMDDKLENNQVNDADRVAYYQAHFNALDEAIKQGVDVRGYFAWSLMDNFEWAEGYLKRFGLVYVDYKTQKRTIKQSGLAYKKLIRDRQS